MTRPLEIILHIGFAKTGTTALQRHLHANKAQLLGQGVLWPGSEDNHHLLQALGADDPDALMQVRDRNVRPGAARAFCEGWFAAIAEEIETTSPERVVLSTEYLNALKLEELMRLKAPLHGLAERVRIVAYVRDYWSMAISTAQQNLRDGIWAGPVSLDFSLDYYEALERFRIAFGGAIDVRLYRRDIVMDFLRYLGVQLEAPHALHNESMGLFTACMLSALNAKFPGFDEKGVYLTDRARGWMVECLSEAFKDSEPPIRMSAKTAESITAKSARDRRLIEARYFGGEPVFAPFLETMEFEQGDDTLGISRLDAETIASGMMAAMRSLAERGIFYQEKAFSLRPRSPL